MFAAMKQLAQWFSRNGIEPPKITLSFPDRVSADLCHETISKEFQAMDLQQRSVDRRARITLFGLRIEVARNNSSGFKGVHYSRSRRAYVATIMTGDGRINLGAFDDPKAAHVIYCEAAEKYFGTFARSG